MTDVIKRSRLKCGVFTHYLLRTAEPTVRGFYEIFYSEITWSCREEIKLAESNAKKRRFPLYMTAEQDTEINEFVDNGYAKSQNDFINKAIEFYIGYLRNEKNTDYIAPILSSILKSQMTDIERNLSEIIFKLAVEVAKQNHLLSLGLRIGEEDLVDLNDRCCRDVASNNGIIQFEDAYRYQYRYDEDGDE